MKHVVLDHEQGHESEQEDVQYEFGLSVDLLLLDHLYKSKADIWHKFIAIRNTVSIRFHRLNRTFQFRAKNDEFQFGIM